MATREYILNGVYVSETGARSEILAPGVYVVENITASSTAVVTTTLYSIINVG